MDAFCAAVIVTVACTELDPLSVTCVGEIAQVVPPGAPLQESDTVPLNSPTGVIVNVYVPEVERATVSEAGDTSTVKSDTNCENADEVLPAKFELLDVNTATTEWLPALKEFVEYCALPPERLTVAAAVLLPSK